MDTNFKLQELLKDVFAISSKEYQRRVWIAGEGPECDDFDETVNFFFDYADGVLKDYKDFGITDIQYKLLKKFYEEFDAFVDSPQSNSLPDDFIDSPEWTKITEMAKEVLKAFNWKMPESGHLC